MKTKIQVLRNSDVPQTTLRICIIVFLALGVFFRFVNLDQKVYWGDEVATSRRISGYTETELEQQLFDGKLISVSNLQKYQYPSVEKSTSDTIKSLIIDDVHPPLYFISLRSWVISFGNSISAIRSFSAIISLLTFPFIYWFCQELFQSKWVSWTAVAMTAISPVHIVYAQEARQYSLWIATILLSSTILLRAIRRNSKIEWVAYAATVIASLYTHLFFGFIAVGHGIYVVITERFKFSKVSIAYLLASLISLFAFVPWLWVISRANTLGSSTTGWTDLTPSPLSMLVRIVGVISRTFVDFGISPNNSLVLMLSLTPVVLILLALIGYSFYFVVQHSSERVWLFIFTLIGVTSLFILFSYVILDKQIATTRYLLPVSLGIQLSVSYLLANKLKATTISGSIGQQRLWKILIIFVSLLGVLSCTIRNQSQVWWNQVPKYTENIPQIAKTINQVDRPLIISDGERGRPRRLLYGLIHWLEPKTKLQLLLESDIPIEKYDSRDIFLFQSSEELRAKTETLYDAKANLVVDSLWQIKNYN